MAFSAVSWNQGCGEESILGYAYADMRSDACDRMQSIITIKVYRTPVTPDCRKG